MGARARPGRSAAEHAAHAPVDRVVALPVAVVAGLAEVGDRRDHESRVGGVHDVRPEPGHGQPSGRLALEQDIGRTREGEDFLATRRSGPVDLHTALVRALGEERKADAIDKRWRGSSPRTARRFNENDVGTQIGE